MYREIATHAFANGDTITVGRTRSGAFVLAFGGPGGLETTLSFNRVDVAARTIELSSVTAEARHVKTGSLEGQPQDFGAVGAWLDQYADDPHAAEGVPV